MREYRHADGSVSAELTWKGPTVRSADGYKQREEIELAIGGDGRGAAAAELLRALGYEPVQTIDRWMYGDNHLAQTYGSTGRVFLLGMRATF